MADALVSIALQKITDALEQRVSLFLGATGELEKLSTTFKSIQALLHDAESKQAADENVRLWLSRLKEAAFDIDDLLDERLISGLENEGSDTDGTRGIKLFTKVFACVSRYKIARKVKEIRERLDQIADDKNKYSFSANGSSVADGGSRPPMTSLMASSHMIGRANDKQILISKLVSGSSQEEGKIRVVAIIGIEGLGKTTLAQEICNSKEVKDHFKKIVWVCVTENFDIIRIIKAILEDLEGASTSLSELGSLQKKLCEALEGKRFLLVLDDIWNEDEEKWKALRLSLTSGASGSRILVTTCNANVGTTMAAAYDHWLNGLSDDDCWKLFSSRAFAGWKAEDCSKLERIGKEIAKKCEGVPLLAQVIGSAMNSKKKRADWMNILDSAIWSLPEATDKMLSISLLSYCNLPVHLKQCFKYCSMFPKDEELPKDMLVRLWVAQGFIQPQGNRELEDIGAEYFDDLVAWSMIQVVERYGAVKYKVHDLLHNLAQLISNDESGIFVIENSGQCSINVRHASLFFNNYNPGIPFAFHKAKRLRTLYLNRVQKIDKNLVSLLRRARLLRALHFSASTIQMLPKNIGKLYHLRYLDLSHSKIENLPDNIGKLKYLRYLDASYSKITELPKSTSHLRNLHCLKLNSCVQLQRLPRGMGRMVSLRHLEIVNTRNLECLPKGLGRISTLRTLCKFIVGGEGGCGLDELQPLNYLQESLTIEHMERASSEEEARKAQLWKKSYLHTLHLCASGNGENKMMDGVLEGLQPHTNLEVLKIDCRSSSKLPSWIEDSSFSKLTNVILDGFIHCANLPGLGNLPALKRLRIERVGVKKVGHEFYRGNSSSHVGRKAEATFPKLEELVLQYMPEFEKWEFTSDNREKTMPSLQVLKLHDCPKLETLPHHLATSLLKDLTIAECSKINGEGCNFPHLEEFRLTNSSEFFSGGLPDLPSLKILHIIQMRNEELTDEGWERLKTLEELKILHCKKLESLPKGLGRLVALKSLDIASLEELTELPDELGELKSLQTLRIDGCPKLESMPDAIEDLNALRSLEITNCEALGPLLRGLRVPPNHLQLEIRGCPRWSETREWEQRQPEDSSDEGSDKEGEKEGEREASGSDIGEWRDAGSDASGSEREEWTEEEWAEREVHVEGSEREGRREREVHDSRSEGETLEGRKGDNSGWVREEGKGWEGGNSGSEGEEWVERVRERERKRDGMSKNAFEKRDGVQRNDWAKMNDWPRTDYWAQMEDRIDEVGNSCNIS